MMSIETAMRILREYGYRVDTSNIPGLFFVDGRELTTGQVKGVAIDIMSGDHHGL